MNRRKVLSSAAALTVAAAIPARVAVAHDERVLRMSYNDHLACLILETTAGVRLIPDADLWRAKDGILWADYPLVPLP